MINYIKTLYDGIFNKVKNIFVVKRDELKEILDNEINLIDNDILPQLKELQTELGDGGSIKSLLVQEPKIITDICNALGSKVKDTKSLFAEIEKVCNNLISFHYTLTQLINKNMQAVTEDKGITVKELGLIGLVNKVVAFRAYTQDLIYYYISHVNPTTEPFKGTIERLYNNFSAYCRLMEVLNEKNIKILEKDINKIESASVKDCVDASSVMGPKALSLSNHSIGPAHYLLFDSFIGNPIYHFRMWLEDRAARTNEKNRELKEYFNLIIIDLKKRNNDENDPKLQKQIEYYENKIRGIEFKIAKYENS